MVPLHPKCTNVFLTQHDLSRLKTKPNPSQAGRYLIDCFYSKDDQKEMTWNGSEKKKSPGVNPVLQEAIRRK